MKKITILFGALFLTFLPATQASDTAEDHKIIICHVPPGNEDNVQTIEIDEHALEAHLAHGDSEGSCTDEGVTRLTTNTTINGTSMVTKAERSFSFIDVLMMMFTR